MQLGPAGLGLDASSLAVRDLTDRLICAHSPNGAGCVNRAQYDAATTQQKLSGLYVAASVLGPPRANLLGFGPGNAVGHRERQAVVIDYLLSLLLGVHACDDDGAIQRVQLWLCGLPRG